MPLHRQRPPAFTLMEMIASMVIVALLMLAIVSVVRLAVSTLGNGLTNTTNGGSSADLASQITADLNVGLNFTEKTSSAVTFTVPDRDGSGGNESIRYAWSGPPPAASPYTLTRTFNGGAAVTLSSNVRTFNLSYLYRSMSPAATVTESQVAAFTGLVLSQNDAVSTTTYRAAVFQPSFSGSPSSWTLTRVSLYLLASSPYDGIFRVRICTVDSSHKPVSTLASVLIPEGSLADTVQWVDVPFSLQVNNTNPLAIVLDGVTATGNSCSWQGSGLIVLPTGSYSTTYSSGAWSTPTTTYGYLFKVYGTVP